MGKRGTGSVSPLDKPNPKTPKSSSNMTSVSSNSGLGSTPPGLSTGIATGMATGIQTTGQGIQSYMFPPTFQYPQQMYMNPGSPVYSQQLQQNSCTTNIDILQSIQLSLENVNKKLGQLDLIQASVSDITAKLNVMDRKICEIEESQKFVCVQYDKLNDTADEHTRSIDSLKSEIKQLTTENTKLKQDNNTFRDDIIDLKCRSMRDNLLFMGIPEGSGSTFPIFQNEADLRDSPMEAQLSTCLQPCEQTEQEPAPVDLSKDAVSNSAPSVGRPETYASVTVGASSVREPENCEAKVRFFCKNILKISNPNIIHIDRAHRVGPYVRGKTRPIVVKFCDTNSKLTVKNALRGVNLRPTDYNVSEQFPQEVKERRKELIPKLIEARRTGKRAVLVRDKLFINNVLYTPEATVDFSV
jgi:uncharacterized protein YoxC